MDIFWFAWLAAAEIDERGFFFSTRFEETLDCANDVCDLLVFVGGEREIC